MLDALVIGAGPSGSRTAWNLAKAGYSTALVEEHEMVAVSYTHLTLPTILLV